ncbi:MAG: 50S ribosomal protein L20 [Candidatus Fonsibacter ubiquis]|nr:50S ribosomal protein L20 [Candidatus Fonsibacter ubiquis]
MYKIKTKSSAKKRFRITATGKVKMPQAGKRHGMIKRSNAQIRRQRGMAIMSKPDAKIVKSYMPKGFYGRKKNTIRTAKQSVEKSFQYSYRDRRQKKRNFRSLWIQRINAGVREQGLTYSKFINGLNKTKISIDRKILADLAYQNPEAFKSIVKKVQSSLN